MLDQDQMHPRCAVAVAQYILATDVPEELRPPKRRGRKPIPDDVLRERWTQEAFDKAVARYGLKLLSENPELLSEIAESVEARIAERNRYNRDRREAYASAKGRC